MGEKWNVYQIHHFTFGFFKCSKLWGQCCCDGQWGEEWTTTTLFVHESISTLISQNLGSAAIAPSLSNCRAHAALACRTQQGAACRCCCAMSVWFRFACVWYCGNYFCGLPWRSLEYSQECLHKTELYDGSRLDRIEDWCCGKLLGETMEFCCLGAWMM